jgi:hypothetical protein
MANESRQDEGVAVFENAQALAASFTTYRLYNKDFH